jgi:hypothetical protein
VRDLPITGPGSSKAEGHHALNVEIEVRVLVPELRGRVAQLAERLSYRQPGR